MIGVKTAWKSLTVQNMSLGQKISIVHNMINLELADGGITFDEYSGAMNDLNSLRMREVLAMKGGKVNN